MTQNDLVSQAQKAYDRKEYRQAANLFQSAALSASGPDAALQQAELNNNSSVAWLLAGNAQQALQAAEGTDTVFATAGDLRRQAMALGNQAAAYQALGQVEAALDRYQRASDLLKEVDDADLRAYVLQNIAELQLKSGDQLQSIATMHAALESKKKLSLKERFLKKLLRVPFKIMR